MNTEDRAHIIRMIHIACPWLDKSELETWKDSALVVVLSDLYEQGIIQEEVPTL